MRDLLLGKPPKDFDVGTNAHPSEIKKLFRNCRIVGRRFRIAHVYFKGGKIIEVSTFRRAADPRGGSDGDNDTSRSKGENVFGEPHEDALRRDLTINGLFYDIATFSVVDYVGGMADLSEGIIRAIGNPDEKFREDPVRMIRAIRHAARTGFRIEDTTYKSILAHSHLIGSCNRARLLDEFQKDLTSGSVRVSIELLQETGVLRAYYPQLSSLLESPPCENTTFYTAQWLWSALEHIDHWANRNDLPTTIFYVPFVFPLIENKLLCTDFTERAEGQRTTLHALIRESTSPLGISRRDIEGLTLLWIGLRRLERYVSGSLIPPSFRRKSYFNLLVTGYRLKWLSHGVPPADVDAQIEQAVAKGMVQCRRHGRKRKPRKRLRI